MNKLKKWIFKERIRRFNNDKELLKSCFNFLQNNHTLQDCYNVHIKLGKANLCYSRSICPNKYGVFRTESIATMSPEEVFLGDIYGLWTHTLTFWQSCHDEDAVEKITKQYYYLLISGIESEMYDYDKDLEIPLSEIFRNEAK